MANHTNQKLIPDTFRNFDQLPDCGFVRQPVVEKLFACSAATVWRWVADRRIPKPRKLSHRVTGWNVGQLRAALASLLSEGGGLSSSGNAGETISVGNHSIYSDPSADRVQAMVQIMSKESSQQKTAPRTARGGALPLSEEG